MKKTDIAERKNLITENVGEAKTTRPIYEITIQMTSGTEYVLKSTEIIFSLAEPVSLAAKGLTPKEIINHIETCRRFYVYTSSGYASFHRDSIEFIGVAVKNS